MSFCLFYVLVKFTKVVHKINTEHFFQDFEGLTPNSLCRVVETVSGGGLVIFLAPELHSLRQLFSTTMDIHSRLKTYSHPKVIPLFNER